MDRHSEREERHGRREDEARVSASIDEAQPLQAASFELADFDTEGASRPRRRLSPLSFGIEPPFWVRVRRTCNDLRDLVGGRHPPRVQTIDLWLPSIQNLPADWLGQRLPLGYQKPALLAFFCSGWIAVVTITLVASTSPGPIQGSNQIIQQVESFWRRDNKCGLDGIECRPFNGTSFVFRCSANCAQVQVLNPHAVGPQDIVYRPLVIGGPVYQGDSFICGSAIHAGVISDVDGGCGIVSRVGQQGSFSTTKRNGIESIEFNSYFSLSFEFTSDPNVHCKLKDQQWVLLAVSLTFTVSLSIFTTSAPLFFFIAFTGQFAHVGLVSDPPGVSQHSVSVLPELFSKFVSRCLPAAFCAVVIYWTCIRRSLDCLTAQVEKAVFWTGGAWVGALNNYTFDHIPLQRLTSHDLEQQPGAKLSLAIILVIIAMIVIQQAWHNYLHLASWAQLADPSLYSSFTATPRHKPTNSALAFSPGTALGLFINGVARWGFDPVLQTSVALQQDASFGSLLPSILDPMISLGSSMSNISFTWADPPPLPGYDGISILVNDVERYRSYFGEALPINNHFIWERNAPALPLPEYSRFGYLSVEHALDYTKAGTWNVNGSWTPMD